MSLDFRPYQLDDLSALEERWRGPQRRLGLVWATGLGKTHGIAHQAVRTVHEGGRAVVVAHRDFLLDQITERIGQHDPRIPVGRVQANVDQCRRLIVVASAQTIANPRRLERLGRFGKVITDEAHHYAAPTFRGVLEGLGSFDGVPTLGVTATMRRDDKKHGLGDVWEDIVAERDIVWAVKNGWLVPPRGKVVVADHMDLEHAKVSRGDYSDAELGMMVTQDADQIARAWLEHGEGRPTASFGPTVGSSQAVAEALRGLGVPVGEVYGKTVDRRPIYDDLEAGRIRVLCSVMVPTEGWDCPPVSCILQCRPTRSRTLFTQIVGRGLRLYPGKTDCLVLDVVGASRGQKLFGLTQLLPSAIYDAGRLGSPPGEAAAREAKEPNRLVGPARYAEVDLLGETALRWLVTSQGVRFLVAGERVIYLWPDTNNPRRSATWSIITANLKGDHAQPGDVARDVPLTLEEATALAERHAVELVPDLVAEQNRPWRTARVSGRSGQVTYARLLGIARPEAYTRGRLSDEMDVLMASARLAQAARWTA
jgi:superfamily II DNA or RNA helicase